MPGHPKREWQSVPVPEMGPPISLPPKEIALPPIEALEAAQHQPGPGVTDLEEVQRAIYRPSAVRERHYRERLQDLASKILLALIEGGTPGQYLEGAAEKCVAVARKLLAAVDAAEMPEQGG